jgi:hypothetical protein
MLTADNGKGDKPRPFDRARTEAGDDLWRRRLRKRRAKKKCKKDSNRG